MNVVDTIPMVTFWTEAGGGSLRINKTRVSLDTVAYHYFNGETPEKIADKFPALRLSEVYAVISYILDNRAKVEKYLEEEEEICAQIESGLREKHGSEWAESRKAMLEKAY